jgi:O-6-methylguanine DNA methyltransferase
MMTRRNDENWTTILEAPAPSAGFAARLVRGVRKRREVEASALEFDLAASADGLASLRPGTGRTEADSRRARVVAERAREELGEYLAGVRSFFTVPVDLAAAGAFQRSVLDAARSIPFGELRSYRWIAEHTGSPAAVRAVGTALGRNPVPIVVPCHRVVRSDGALGGYAFGLDLKTRLLTLERETPALVGSDTTRIVCRHGCVAERRIGAAHRVVFTSVAEARSAGYRPCKLCLSPLPVGERAARPSTSSGRASAG